MDIFLTFYQPRNASKVLKWIMLMRWPSAKRRYRQKEREREKSIIKIDNDFYERQWNVRWRKKTQIEFITILIDEAKKNLVSQKFKLISEKLNLNSNKNENPFKTAYLLGKGAIVMSWENQYDEPHITRAHTPNAMGLQMNGTKLGAILLSLLKYGRIRTHNTTAYTAAGDLDWRDRKNNEHHYQQIQSEPIYIIFIRN